MEQVLPQQTRRKVEKIEQKVKELEHEVVKVKQDNAAQPTGTVKREVQELTTNSTESQRKIITLTLIAGAVLLLLGVLALILMKGAFLWLSIILLLGIVFMSDRAR